MPQLHFSTRCEDPACVNCTSRTSSESPVEVRVASAAAAGHAHDGGVILRTTQKNKTPVRSRCCFWLTCGGLAAVLVGVLTWLLGQRTASAASSDTTAAAFKIIYLTVRALCQPSRVLACTFTFAPRPDAHTDTDVDDPLT